MIPLFCKGQTAENFDTIVAPVTYDINAHGKILLWDLDTPAPSNLGCLAVLTPRALDGPESSVPCITNLNRWGHFTEGDIVAVHPQGRVETLFRIQSPHNSLFITDRCNSNCLMCSQPPRNIDDLDALYNLNSRLISLIPKDTEELGITGGEPTLPVSANADREG